MSFATYQWPNEHQSQDVHHISNPHGLVQSQSWGLPGQQLTSQQHQQCGPQGHLQLNRYGNYYHKYSLPLSHYCYPGREIGYHVANSGVHSKGQSFNDNICRIPYDISSNRQLPVPRAFFRTGTWHPWPNFNGCLGTRGIRSNCAPAETFYIGKRKKDFFLN